MKLEPHYIVYTMWGDGPCLLENVFFNLSTLLNDLHEGQDRVPGRKDGYAAKIVYVDLSKNCVLDVTADISKELRVRSAEERRINPDHNPHPLAMDYVSDKEVA